MKYCRFIHRSIEDEEHYRAYGILPVPAERPQAPTNMNQQDHHIAPAHPPPPPPPHLNYYSNCENIISNQQPNQSTQSQFVQNSTMPMMPRRRSFSMAENNIESIMPSKRPHLEDHRSPIVSTATYNTQNGETTRQCHFVEQNVGQSVNVPPTSGPNSMPQIQQPPVSAPSVASVVIAEDVINIYRLYEEHNLLRRRVEINEERLQELRATNTFLLQQNEQLRRQTQCSCTNTIVNPVTLTTASQQSASPVNRILPYFIDPPKKMQLI